MLYIAIDQQARILLFVPAINKQDGDTVLRW